MSQSDEDVFYSLFVTGYCTTTYWLSYNLLEYLICVIDASTPVILKIQVFQTNKKVNKKFQLLR